MFWIAAFMLAGMTYILVDQFAIYIAVAAIVALVLFGVVWLEMKTGLNMVMVRSWQFLSGVDTPDQIIVNNQDNCPMKSEGEFFLSMAMVILLMVIAFANVLVGLVAIIGIPVGIVMTLGGAAMTVYKEAKHDLLPSGLQVLTYGLGAMILAGIVMRIMHIGSTWVPC